MDLNGVENWTRSDSSCLNIQDMDLDQEQKLEVTGLVEADSDDEDGADEESDRITILAPWKRKPFFIWMS